MKKVKKYIVAGALATTMALGAISPTVSVAASAAKGEPISSSYMSTNVMPYADNNVSDTLDKLNGLMENITNLSNMLNAMQAIFDAFNEFAEPFESISDVLKENNKKIFTSSMAIISTITSMVQGGSAFDLNVIKTELQTCREGLLANLTAFASIFGQVASKIPSVLEKVLQAIGSVWQGGKDDPNLESEALSAQLLSARAMIIEQTNEVDQMIDEVIAQNEVATNTVTVEMVADPASYALTAMVTAIAILLGAMLLVSVKKYNA